jgi:hypothetical protein
VRSSHSVWFAALAIMALACSSNSSDTPPSGATGTTTTSSGSTGSSGTGSTGSSGTGSSGAGTTTSGTGGPNLQDAAISTSTDCGLMGTAFCETFDKKVPEGRGGPLDESIWAFSRYGHFLGTFMVRVPASTVSVDIETKQPTTTNFPPKFCGADFMGLVPGTDIEMCDGLDGAGLRSLQLNEVYHDAGDFALNSMMVRQPFDFTGRSGTITFDVDGKINPFNEGHGWWVEAWVTEDPAPIPYHESPTVQSYPRNGIGFAFEGADCNKTKWENSLTHVIVTKNYQILHDYGASDFDSACFKTADQMLNRFKIVMTQDQAEVWVSDFDKPGMVRKIATIPKLGATFTRGYVHFQHSQYNANKDKGTPSQTYRWDNIGFDGPVLPKLRAFDVQEPRKMDMSYPGTLTTGWEVSPRALTTVTAPGLDLTGATKAYVNFNIMAEVGRTLTISLNGAAAHNFKLPMGPPGTDGDYGLRAYTVEVPLSELKAGDNSIGLKMLAPDTGDAATMGNIDISLEAP